jgi:hypothetical protein
MHEKKEEERKESVVELPSPFWYPHFSTDLSFIDILAIYFLKPFLNVCFLNPRIWKSDYVTNW